MAEEDGLNPFQSEFESQEAHMSTIEYDVKKFVADQGYGAWYQREAWKYIGKLPVWTSPFYIVSYLNNRYPKLDFEGE